MARNLQRQAVPRESERPHWNPRPYTKVPKLFHFTGVAHLSPKGQSLTERGGWRSSLVSDGLDLPWSEREGIEVPAGAVVTHGLISASPSDGYWAVLYATHSQAQRLVTFGQDINSPGQTSWPTLTVGLEVPGLEARWPGLRTAPISPQARQWAQHPLMTPTAIVHRLLAIGVAPASEITSKLSLLGRSTESLMGVGWFGFHRGPSGQLFVSQVSAAGDATSLGRADSSTLALMVERSWGISPQLAASLESRGVRLPASLDGFEEAVGSIEDEIMSNQFESLAGTRLPASSIEDRLNGAEGPLQLLPTPGSIEGRLIGISSRPPGTSLMRRLEPDTGLLLAQGKNAQDVASSSRVDRHRTAPTEANSLCL